MAGVTGDVAEPQQAGVGKLGQCLRLTISGNPAVRRVKTRLRCRGYAVRSGRGGRGRHGGVRHRLPGGAGHSIRPSPRSRASARAPPPAGARSSPAKGRPQPRRWPICSPGRAAPAFLRPLSGLRPGRRRPWSGYAPARRDPSASAPAFAPAARTGRRPGDPPAPAPGATESAASAPACGQPTTGIPRSRSRERRETGSSQALSCIHV